MLLASSPTCRSMAQPLAHWWPLSTVRRTYPIARLWASKTRTVLHDWAKRQGKPLRIFVVDKHPDGTCCQLLARRCCQPLSNFHSTRDYELRFTVHESPDYFKLKVSVFNDDKKTDLIGETWIDLNNLIIPGGSQNDHWHSLQCRGKYAGDIRIEMTYYDTRELDEAVIGRRKEAAERIQGKASAPANSGLAGPRQFDKFKRRPLPVDPSGAAPPRPPAPEHVHSAPPLHHPQPSRPAMHDHGQTMPPAAGPDSLNHFPQQSEFSHEAPPYGVPTSAMHARAAYDGPDGYQREWNAPVPALPPAGMLRRASQEPPYPVNEAPDAAYDLPPLQPRSQSYDHPPPRDHRAASEPPFDHNMHAKMQFESSQPPDPYSVVSPQYNVNPMTFGQVSTFSPRSSMHVDEPAPLNYSRPGSLPGPVEDPRYQSPARALLPPARSNGYHPEYASMQPSVEDEEEDAPPPPPPVHGSRLAQPGLSPANQTSSSYTPYSPTHPSNPVVPASLVAGYEAEEHIDQSVFEDRSGRRRSTHYDDEMMLARQPATVPAPLPAPQSYDSPIYPFRTSPQPMDQPSAPISGRGGSASPDDRIVTRKSVSPRPSSSSDRGGSSIPFSPDSYNSLNPHASQAKRDASPGYDTPSRAREASPRSESESVRDPDQPIIDDNGREIDPSDHLPTDTWAPEPERKSRKPEVIIRFKHSPRPTSRGNDTTPVRSTPPRVGFKTTPDVYGSDRPSKRYTPTHVHPEPMVRTPPRADRGHDSYGNYTNSRGYSTPTSADRPRSSHRGSVSPTPNSRSPLYDYSPGPPVASTVPVTGAPAYPVSPSHASGSVRPGVDALSRELSTIDIGSVGCSPGRAVRQYAPRPSARMGYAS